MSKYNLITGATGIVGIHLMLNLLQRGERVRAMVRKSSDTTIVRRIFAYYDNESLFNNIDWIEGDMLDPDSLHRAIDGCQRIFHTAAMVSFDKRDHDTLWQTNVDATAYLVDMALECGVEAFCHVSSIGALGHESDGVITESTHWQPDNTRSVYSQSKFRQEMEIWRGIQCGLNATIVNPGVILGPGTMGRSSQQILQTIVKGVPFYVDGRTGYTDARDVAHAMIELTLAEKWGERYIIVGHNSSVRDLQVLFAKALETKAPSIKAGHNLIMCAAYLTEAWNKITGSRSPLTVESARSMGGENYYSSEKLIETINIQFTPLEESVRNMVSFYKYNKNITHEQ